MSSAIALGKDVQETYQAIVAGDESLSWAVYGYDGQTELRVQATGSRELDDFVEEFSDGRLQYAFLRVKDPNSNLPKFVLIGWCGDGAPRKGVFQQHFSSVASKLTGYHVQITARSEEDLAEEHILRKVEDASGAKYSVSSTANASSAATVARKPTTNSLVNQLKSQHTNTYNSRKPSQTEPRLPPSGQSVKPSVFSTKPVANSSKDEWEVPKTNQHSRTGFRDFSAGLPSVEPVKSTYQPIGQPDISALRAQGEKASPTLAKQGTGTNYEPPEVPKTIPLADRMSAFKSDVPASAPSTTRPRNGSNPLASRFGGATGATKAAFPTSGPRDSKAIGGLAKNFGSEGGKTPAQLWAERKARERGEVVPEAVREAPVKATVYGDDQSSESAHVSDMRERFANTDLTKTPNPSLAPNKVFSATPAPVSIGSVNSTREPKAEPIDDDEEDEPDMHIARKLEGAPPPPLPNMTTRPTGASLQAIPVPVPEIHNQVEHEGYQAEEEQKSVEEEQDEEAAEVMEPRVEPEPEVETNRNSFKAQLAQQIGGSAGSTHIEPAARGDPHVETKSQHQTPQARALYDYEAQEDNELTLEEGDLVTDIEMIDDGWWSGHNPQGQSGLFPSNYVELIEDGSSSAHVHEEMVDSTHGSVTAPSGKGQCATAVYEYEAAEEGEIGFAEGELIEEIDQIDEGWWKGTNARGEEGLFPANYVELV